MRRRKETKARTLSFPGGNRYLAFNSHLKSERKQSDEVGQGKNRLDNITPCKSVDLLPRLFSEITLLT